MIKKEVNDWIRKVECNMSSYDDLMYEFSQFAKYLTKDELIMLKKKLSNYAR